MAREIKRLCWNCAEDLQKAGQGCKRVENAGGSTGICSGCGKPRVCESYEITYGRATQTTRSLARNNRPDKADEL